MPEESVPTIPLGEDEKYLCQERFAIRNESGELIGTNAFLYRWKQTSEPAPHRPPVTARIVTILIALVALAFFLHH